MTWQEVRKAYPNQWLVIEAIEAHTEEDRRLLDQIAVVETSADGASAFQASSVCIERTLNANSTLCTRGARAWTSVNGVGSAFGGQMRLTLQDNVPPTRSPNGQRA